MTRADDLSVISVEVRGQTVPLDEWNEVGRVQDKQDRSEHRSLWDAILYERLVGAATGITDVLCSPQ